MRAVAVRAVREALVAVRMEFIVVCSLAGTELRVAWSGLVVPGAGKVGCDGSR